MAMVHFVTAAKTPAALMTSAFNAVVARIIAGTAANVTWGQTAMTLRVRVTEVLPPELVTVTVKFLAVKKSAVGVPLGSVVSAKR